MSWHIQADAIERYAQGHIGEASAFSLEAHVLACAECRQALSGHVDAAQLDRAWVGIRDAIDRPKVRAIERVLVRVGIPANTARLLVASATLRSSWLVAVGVGLAVAVLFSRTVATNPLPFLMLAPLVPLVGVAAVAGGSADPAWEIGLASPVGGFHLMLIKAAGVLATSCALAAIAAIAMPALGWEAAAWLLPSVGLTLTTLVVASVTASSTTAASIVGAAWLVGVVVVERTSAVPLAAFGPLAQVGFTGLIVVAGAALVARHGSFERPTKV